MRDGNKAGGREAAGRGAGGSEAGAGTVVSGGNRRRVQVRKSRPDAFGDEKKQIVLDHLASCCNIRAAAEAAGITPETVNAHRRRDPEFAQACAEAIEAGEMMLHSLAIERAAGGTGYVPGGTAVPGPGTVDTELALRLLSLRNRPVGRRTGDGGHRPKRASEKELKEAILAKLELLSRRLRKAGVGGGAGFRDAGALRDGSSTGSAPPQGERGGAGLRDGDGFRDAGALRDGSSTSSAPPQGERGGEGVRDGAALRNAGALRDGSSTGSAPPQGERGGARLRDGAALRDAGALRDGSSTSSAPPQGERGGEGLRDGDWGEREG